MRVNTICLLGLVLLVSSCASIKPTDFRPDNQGCIQLPALDPVMDAVSLESMYPDSYISSDSGSSSDIYVSSVSRNRKAQDVRTLFEREVKDCITNPYGELKGYIVCKVSSGYSRMNPAFTFWSTMTLGIPNLLGLPYAVAKTLIDLDVEIYTIDNRLIGRYNASGYDRSYSAYYYGYRLADVSRISGINAFKMAMNDIKSKIERDKNRLEMELNKVGDL
jgi:hypothetical protein